MGICPRHGGPLDECSDPDKDWFPQRIVCRAEMEQQAAEALYADLHEKKQFHNGSFTSWAETRSESHPYRYDDGVKIITTPVDLNPDDEFLSARPSAQQSVGDEPEASQHPDNH